MKTEQKTFTVSGLEELDQVVNYLLSAMTAGPKLVLLYGDLGAGKTTLVKRIVAQMGSTDDTSSPTYGLVNEYEVLGGIFYHIDLYRIGDTEEALDMGIEHYIHSDACCCVEWPQVIEPLVDTCIRVEITLQENGSRLFAIDKAM